MLYAFAPIPPPLLCIVCGFLALVFALTAIILGYANFYLGPKIKLIQLAIFLFRGLIFLIF